MNKPTIESAIIEANRAKNPGRPTTDYDHRARCMDVLIDADKLLKHKYGISQTARTYIKTADTIIEAEVSEE